MSVVVLYGRLARTVHGSVHVQWINEREINVLLVILFHYAQNSIQFNSVYLHLEARTQDFEMGGEFL